MTVAINADGRHSGGAPAPSKLIGCGFQGVRILSAPDAWGYGELCRANGLAVLGIVTDESNGYILPSASIIQVGNEPDLDEPAADHMPPEDYAEMWRIYRETYPYVPMFSAGFASGQPDYWQQVYDLLSVWGTELPDAVSVHPYGKSAGAAADLIDAYWNISGIPVAVTEWWHPAGGNFIWPMQDMLETAEDARATIWNSYFCWSDAMVGGFGLTDRNDHAKQEGYELVSALGGSF